eukprot:scaffold37851_cov48-Attheya_sp.AAC.2
MGYGTAHRLTCCSAVQTVAGNLQYLWATMFYVVHGTAVLPICNDRAHKKRPASLSGSYSLADPRTLLLR